ncbi:TonB-dependent receptor [Methylophaga thiooxydans]|uniref:TonB-dependent receptor n=1 Tax=Methylophaga thiooxydans TaxID=392484 RepID=A0A0A0BDR2_9GAMM|nr:TonB-dependent receptor [Methylophaga thiooxydans]KGM05817.1 TonB-dependent receptor [Methylophaga thiooxydans]
MGFKPTILAGSFAVAASAGVYPAVILAEDVPAELDTVTVIGDSDAARKLPGSAAVVSNEQLTIEAATDIHQVLKTVPGIYIQEEDGFGLRPNIGIRAASPERSQNITLMEDGVLIAPAPYSNPAAYYFPTTSRLHSIEVLKGAPLLRYGPQTVGGVVNLVSTPIPETNQGSATFMMNDRGSADLHLNYGGKTGPWGYSIETAQRHYQGFKDIDRNDDNSGFQIEDYVAKLSWEGERNQFLFKIQRSMENSDETYAGLTDADFRRDENRRYGLTHIDEMDNQHTGINLSHVFDWTDNLTSTVTAYRNEFKRNWFKFDGKYDRSTDPKGKDIIEDANAGIAKAIGVLNGSIDDEELFYKNNNRTYDSYGIQANFNWFLGEHDINFGARQHFDETDRFQPVEVYNQVDGELVYDDTNAVGSSDNRLEEAQALSLWITDDFQVTDRLLLNLSLRMEDVETKARRYDGGAARSSVSSRVDNDYREYLVGISGTYDLTDSWQVLAGYHEGMIPLGAGAEDGTEPGKSDNYELGLRFQQGVFYSEAIAFYSDFSNLVEQCSVAAPCSNDAESGSFSVGGAEVKGLEFQAGSLFTAGDFMIPVDLTYTYTDAETTSGDEFSAGQELQNIPENIVSLRVGLEHNSGWNNYAVVKYIDETCVSIGCNESNSRLDRTDALTTVDLMSRYRLDLGPVVFVKVENLFDRQEIISRSPFGARPNIERTVWAGASIDF